MRMSPTNVGDELPSIVSSSHPAFSSSKKTAPTATHATNGGIHLARVKRSTQSSTARICHATKCINAKLMGRRMAARFFCRIHPCTCPHNAFSNRRNKALACGPVPPHVCQPMGENNHPFDLHKSASLAIFAFSVSATRLFTVSGLRTALRHNGWVTTSSKARGPRASKHGSPMSAGHSLPPIGI